MDLHSSTCKACGSEIELSDDMDKESVNALKVGLCSKCHKEFKECLAEYKQAISKKDKMIRPGKYADKGI